jgi:gluconolactonase
MPTAIRVAVLLFVACAAAARAAEKYELGPDSKPQDGVPVGEVTKHRWTASKVFPGTERDYWVYVPKQYDGSQPACVMVFQDGESFVKPDGAYRAPIVLDNLIHKKDIPVTIGVFINPGVIPALGDNRHPRYNRSFEYDTPDGAYAKFVLDEILAEVGKTHKLTNEATGRGICGSSSGGICAFTAAWERPDAFSRVVSFIGSFVDLRGGNDYPGLVRRTEPKPIRVYLQDGRNDLDIYAGSWFHANQDLSAALKFAGYEHEFVVGDEAHNGKHGGAVLPDALRFAWKDYPKLPAKGTFPLALRDGRPSVIDIVDPNEPWVLVGEGFKSTNGPACDASGNVFFTDVPNDKIYRVDLDGEVSLFVDGAKGPDGATFGPDGRLYVVQNKANRIVAYSVPDAKEEVIAEDVEGNDLCVAHDGGIYVTESKRKRITYISPKRDKRVAEDTGLEFPNGIILTPDQSQLIVSDMRTRHLFIWRAEAGGGLSNRQPYYSMHVPAMARDGGGDGLKVDAEGRVYCASRIGIQVFDQAGRVNAIIPKPTPAGMSSMCFGGKDLDMLYVTNGPRVYKRKIKARGVLSFQAPVLPPKPKL